MKFEEIKDVNSDAFKKCWEIYQSSFPEDKKRSLEQQTALFGRWQYHFQAVHDPNEIIGIIELWYLTSSRTFIEHFAIQEESRGRGLGTKVISEFLALRTGLFFLEIDPPLTEEARRRALFWSRHGFKVNYQKYIQPPYRPGSKPVRMVLMSRHERLIDGEFNAVRNKIHHEVYGLKRSLVKWPHPLEYL